MKDKQRSERSDSNGNSIVTLRAVLVGAMAVMLAGLAGCVAPANDRLTLNHMGSFETDVGVQSPATHYRSLETIGRREWERVTYVVPVDSVVHGPTYAPTIEMTNKSARQRGEYPTIETAFELSEGSLGQRIKEAFAGPFVGMGQGVAAMGLFFVDPQVNGDESPSMAYQRSGPKAIVHPPIVEWTAPDEAGIGK